jgi:hypothetical protein
MRSGLNVPTPAIPIPDFAVPYAAPAHPRIIFNAGVSTVDGRPKEPNILQERFQPVEYVITSSLQRKHPYIPCQRTEQNGVSTRLPLLPLSMP